jgi:hypothetical protein
VLVLAAWLGARSTRIEGRIDVPGNPIGGIAVRVIPAGELESYLAQRVPEALTTLDERRTVYRRSEEARARDLASGRTLTENARLRLLAWETDMLADLPETGTVVTTDDDGRFDVSLPRQGRAAVFASGDFRIEGMVQRRAWGLWVRLDARTRTLTLDTNHMLLAEPDESVLR